MGQAQSGPYLSLVLGFKTMTYSFGDDADDEINHARNGIFMENTVEKLSTNIN
jgi:hypothetical protein